MSLEEMKMSIFITKCDQHTVANLINLKSMGIKNIYMSKCQPNLINPTLMNYLVESFDIREISTPQEDIKATLSQNEEK